MITNYLKAFYARSCQHDNTSIESRHYDDKTNELFRSACILKWSNLTTLKSGLYNCSEKTLYPTPQSESYSDYHYVLWGH